ncbi:GtrA family protein [Anianabacter salinae]|uniref:GtrA family protein n=1 Tax=Anianabacter salinae TaxID=2851023 RepID=UPI00225E4111|nr:GtrA family protein [Anianabacter salinae]
MVRYALFAVVATVANLGVQRAVFWIGGDSAGWFVLAMAAGTGAGLVVKFVADAVWIFDEVPTSLRGGTSAFLLYTATGAVTTLLFWVTETGFWLWFGTDAAREAGAVIGLAFGYTVKYRLDRRFVFRAGRSA